MYAKPMYLEEKLGTHLPIHFEESVKTTELYGIEVELEGKGGISNPTEVVMQNWVKHNDGSLRKLAPGDEAVEYVTRVPSNKLKTTKSLMTLLKFLEGPGKVVYDSYRTSIHVHVNCMADTMLHTYNFITLCIIFDELLASQNGEHRIGNNFCLRARDAEGQISDLVQSINTHGSIFGLNGNWRYSAINFASLCKFGTVEFRSLECTTDLDRIIQWINVIDNMKNASRQFENPHQIIRGFSQASSVKDFCELVLGDMAPKYTSVLGFEQMLFEGMRLAQDFAFCSKWVAKQKNLKDGAPKKKSAFMDFEAHNWEQPQPGLAPAGWVHAQQPPPVWAQAAPQAPQPMYVALEEAEAHAQAQAAAYQAPQPMYVALEEAEVHEGDDDDDLEGYLDDADYEDDF